MSALTNELKSEHAQLASTLGKVKELGIGSPEGKKLLFAAKTALLAHLEKENAKLYPVLRKGAEKDAKLKGTLDTFAKDMEGVASAAMAFFTKYEKEASGLEFGKDFGRLFSVLGERIKKEESILYLEFDKLSK